MNNIYEKAKQMLENLQPYGYVYRPDWKGRTERLSDVLAVHPNTWLEACKNERTGCRFGNRKCRRGRCQKIGSTSTDGKGSGYQIWAVWK